MSLKQFLMKKCFLVLVYIMDTSELERLGALLDAKQKLIEDLQKGIQTTEDLIGQLQASLKAADDQIASITKQVSDNSTIKTVTSQLQDKNTQLQGLVQKFGSAVAAK